MAKLKINLELSYSEAIKLAKNLPYHDIMNSEDEKVLADLRDEICNSLDIKSHDL